MSIVLDSTDLIIYNIPGDSDGKESACNEENLSSIPGLARSSGEGNGSPLQYSCLGFPCTEEPGVLQSWDHRQLDMTDFHFH